MQLERVVRRPLVLTEKGNRLREAENQYLFEVARDANKIQIRKAVETVFKVKVQTVHTLKVRSKPKRLGAFLGRSRSWKKAIVKLAPGERIEFFEGAGA